MEMTPTRMKAFISGWSAANSVRNPTDRKATRGQKRISKRVNTFLLVMIQFLNTKALVLVNSSCKSHEDIFQIRLLNTKIVNECFLADKEIQDLGQAFVMVIHKDPAAGVAGLKRIDSFQTLKRFGVQRTAEGDDDGVSQAQLAFQILGFAEGLDSSVLDEGDLLAKS